MKKTTCLILFLLFFGITSLVGSAQTPADQNFDAQPIDNSFTNPSTDIDGVRYTGGPSSDRFVSVLNASQVSPNPVFSNKAILIGNNVAELGGYAEFFKIDNSTNFKLVSLNIETYPESGDYASEYTIIGYDNGVQKVAVDVNMISAATYGSGNNAIVYSNFYSGASGARSGLLTFGSSWENIDQVRFLMKTPATGYYWIGLDDIDFEPAVLSATAPTTITFDEESFTPGQEIPDGHNFSAIGKSFNIYAGTFNGGVSGEGGMFFDPGDGSLSWNTFPTEFEDGGFITLDYTTDINRRWYDPEALIIKTTDGSDFKFTSFKSHDASWDSWGNYLKITGYKDGVALGSESVIIISDVEPYHSTVTLTNPIFGSIDEVRITLDKDNHPNYPFNGDIDMDGLYQSFDTFVIDNAITSNSTPTVTTTAVLDISATTATLGGNVTNNGGASVTERGIVYNTAGTPNIDDDTKVQIGSGDGSFSDEITGLIAGTTYYVRAYATNTVGTSYGSEESFITSTLGLEEALLNNAISLYPNPINDKLYITNVVEVKNVSLFDILGKRMDHIKIENDVINLSHIKIGIYILKIETDNGNVIKRIVKK